jgi:hypothetical protein
MSDAALQLVPPAAAEPVRHAWLKFFPTDWQADELLRMCSLAAQGLLMQFICLMHRATPYGYLVVNGKSPTDLELSRLASCAGIAELRRLRLELLDKGVLSQTAGGILYSRRMVRKAKESAKGRENGLGGGNPKLLPPSMGTLNPPPYPAPLTDVHNTHKPEAISQNPKPLPGGISDEGVDQIAGAFLELIPEVYARCRSGATYRVSRVKQERDLAYARELAIGWPSVERLKTMYEVFLRRTDIGDINKAGTPGQFLHMAPDCDRLLRENGR